MEQFPSFDYSVDYTLLFATDDSVRLADGNYLPHFEPPLLPRDKISSCWLLIPWLSRIIRPRYLDVDGPVPEVRARLSTL